MTTEEQCPACDDITEVDSHRGGRCSNEMCERWVLPCGTCPSIDSCGFDFKDGSCSMFERDCINDLVPRFSEAEFKLMLRW